MVRKWRVTLDNLIGDHVVGKTELVFTTADDFNRWFKATFEGNQHEVRKLFGVPHPTFTVTTEEA